MVEIVDTNDSQILKIMNNSKYEEKKESVRVGGKKDIDSIIIIIIIVIIKQIIKIIKNI